MLTRSSTLEDICEFLEKENKGCGRSVILFVDQSNLCENYSRQTWIQREQIMVVEVDQEILDFFQVGAVPQFRFYIGGTEVHHLIGTATEEQFYQDKSELFTTPVSINR